MIEMFVMMFNVIIVFLFILYLFVCLKNGIVVVVILVGFVILLVVDFILISVVFVIVVGFLVVDISFVFCDVIVWCFLSDKMFFFDV